MTDVREGPNLKAYCLVDHQASRAVKMRDCSIVMPQAITVGRYQRMHRQSRDPDIPHDRSDMQCLVAVDGSITHSANLEQRSGPCASDRLTCPRSERPLAVHETR